MRISFWLLTITPILALLSYAVLLVLVLRRRIRSRVYRLFALYMVVMMVWSFGSAMMRLDPARILFWNRVLVSSASLMPLVYFGFVQTYLDQRRDRELWVGVVSVLGLEIANVLGLMVTDAELLEGGRLSFEAGPATYVAAIYGAIFWGSSVWRLARARRRASAPVMRNRIAYPLIGLVFVILGTITNGLPALGAFPIDHAANLINAFLLAYAILRYQLLDITLVIRKGLFYSIPTVVIGAGYFLLIWLATVLFPVLAGPQILLLSLLVAVLAAVIAQPLQRRAQLWIDRLFFREKYDSSLMLQRLSRAAASVLNIDRLANMILAEIVATMHIERVAFFLKQGENRGFLLVAHRGLGSNPDLRLRNDHPVANWLLGHERALTQQDVDVLPQFKALWGKERRDLERMATELFIPLKAKGDLVGVLAVGPKLSGVAYSQDDQRTLSTLGNQVAVAIENARLHRELRNYADRLEHRVQERTAQLQAHYARLEAILRSTTDGIVVTDAEGEILQANPVAQALLTHALSPEDTDRLQETVGRLARQVATDGTDTGAADEEWPEAMLELKGLDLELTVAPISEPRGEETLRPTRGKPTAVVDIHDVSELKALDRMKTLFVSNVSHELRTPVTTIKLYVHLMQRQPEKWREHLGTLAREADRQARLVEDILQISRIDAGRLEMKPCETTLEELSQAVVSSHLALAKDRGLTLQYRPLRPSGTKPASPAASDAGPTVWVDPERMTQVLNNLVENAIHYTPDGGTVTVSTGAEEADGRTWATVIVADTGMGIPAEELPHVFERFFRGEEPRVMQISGTGLGLAIVKEIVELHGGHVTVESEEHIGSTFTAWLPLHH